MSRLKEAQLACFNMLTQHIIRLCTLQPSQAPCLLLCSLCVSKRFQTEHMLSLPYEMLKEFTSFKGCGLFFETVADVSFLNGNPMFRVTESRLPFKNDTSATISKNKPQPF